MTDLLADARSEFTVYIVDGDVAGVHDLVEVVKGFGYSNVRVWPSIDAAISAARSNPPHIVVFDFINFEAQAEEGLQQLQDISEEILVLAMINFEQTLAGLEIVGRGHAYDTIVRPFVSNMELAQKMDRAAQRLYFQFESEQLREQQPAEPPQQQQPQPQPPAAISDPQPQAAHSPPPTVFGESSINDFLARISATKDLDETVDIFVQALAEEANAAVLYLKYLPTHATLVIAQAARAPIEKFRGIGIDFKKEGVQNALSSMRDPGEIAALKDLVRSLFGKDAFFAIPHFNDDDALGVFVVLGDIEVSGSSSRALALLGIFELAWKRNHTLKEKHVLDVTDPATGVGNRRHFVQKLEDEISRSRRILMPLALVTIEVDGFKTLNERIGPQQVDAIVKAIAAVLKKTARVSDVVTRNKVDEFALLLPHTPSMGAAIKAERIRRVIEAMKFPLLNHPVTVSCGVSEYPSICSDVDGLVRTADTALSQVRSGGGNKVCLATAPEGHHMDFVPKEVPAGGFTPSSGGPA